MRNWWQERSALAKTAIVVGAVIVIGAVIVNPDSEGDGEAEAAASATTVESTSTSSTATTSEAPTTTEASTTSTSSTTTSTTSSTTTSSTSSTTTTISTTTTTAPATTTTTDPMAAFRFESFEVSGSGDDVVDVAVPDNLPAVLAMTHQGSSNFAVLSHTAENERIDLLVNTIGSYSGQRPVNLYEGENVGFLEITADGPWTVEAIPFSDVVQFENSATGTGDAVLFVTSGGGRLSVTHSGESNFVVMSHGGNRDLLVNEIGNYDGTVLLEGDARVLEVQGDGEWALDLE